MKKDFLYRLNQLRSKGLIIFISGTILVSSSTLTIDALAQSNVSSNDEEILLANILTPTAVSSNNIVYVETDFENPYYDVFNDDELSERASKILPIIEKITGPNNYTEEEIRSMMMIFAGRNPYPRSIQDADVMFVLDRLNQIMDAESQEVGNKFRGFGNAEVKANVPFSGLLPDETHGQNHAKIISNMRARMLLSKTNAEGEDVAKAFANFMFNYYFANGRIVAPGFDETERSGFKLFNLALVLNTANLAVAIAPNTTYQFTIQNEIVLPDGTVTLGEPEICEWDIPAMIDRLLTAPCETNDCDDEYQAKVNYLTDAILGTTAQAASSVVYK